MSKRTPFTIGISLVLMLVLAACSNFHITYDYDKEVDFKKYKTYSYFGWKQQSDSILTPFDKKRIEDLIAGEINSRGLKYVKEGGDLIVSPFAQIEIKKEIQAITDNYGGYYGGYYGGPYGAPWGWGAGPSTTTFQEYNYAYGTLVIDIIDAKEKKLVWQCVGSGTLDENRQRAQKKAPAEIARMFENFPIPKMVEPAQ